VMLRHFKGSRAIGFWTHFAFGLERDTQAEDEIERNTTTFRVLKDRYTGQSNGKTIHYLYTHETGRLNPVSEPDVDACPFVDETEASSSVPPPWNPPTHDTPISETVSTTDAEISIDPVDLEDNFRAPACRSGHPRTTHARSARRVPAKPSQQAVRAKARGPP